jgi:hypothetical protein
VRQLCFFVHFRPLTRSSGFSVHNSTSRIPWTVVQEAPEDFIEDKYLPSGEVHLKQYHHMKVEYVNALLSHWTDRQAAGLESFRFKDLANTDQRGKRAADSEDRAQGDKEHGVSARTELAEHAQGRQGDGGESPPARVSSIGPRRLILQILTSFFSFLVLSPTNPRISQLCKLIPVVVLASEAPANLSATAPLPICLSSLTDHLLTTRIRIKTVHRASLTK